MKPTVSENVKFSQNSLNSSSQSCDFVVKDFDEPAAIDSSLMFTVNFTK